MISYVYASERSFPFADFNMFALIIIIIIDWVGR